MRVTVPEAFPNFNEETLEQLGVPHKIFGRQRRLNCKKLHNINTLCQPRSTLRPFSIKAFENIKDLNICFLIGGSQHRNVQ
jgi:hypothetical protein